MFAELEIGLHRRDADSYGVEVRFGAPESDAEVRLTSGALPLIRFDNERLRQQGYDPQAYGQLLAQSLFGDAQVRTALSTARASSGTTDVPLRLRLFVGPSAPELHGLYWETLRDPEDGGPLFTGEHIVFSRYLSSADWRPVRRRPKGALRALVVIASPANVGNYQPGGRVLAPLDVAAESARAREGLAGIPCTVLASDGRATINNLVRHLREEYEVLYLVCHGAMVEGEPKLWLEDESGRTSVLGGSELVRRIGELRHAPLLIVLASCQSAGSGADARTGDAGALAALGPALAEAGVPAVLAMQGDVTMATLAMFMPVFFRELQRDGQIDRAVAAARGAVRDRVDWHLPVLYMRLKSGCIWYAPGFAGERRLEKWPALLANIRDGRCTPILGPGLTDSLLGSRRELARRWAETYHFPMAPHNREDLPQVAQFLATNQQRSFPQTELIDYLRRDLLERYGDQLPQELHILREPGVDQLIQLISVLGKQRRDRDPGDPFRVLADLPVKVYITAAPNDLLSDALAAAGKKPRVDFCRWKDELLDLPSVYYTEEDFRPDLEAPLVYHLFGRLQYPDSLVLTEDDFFDFLIGVTKNKELVPPVVKRAAADNGLLILGFQLDDWNFRAMYRAMIEQEGGRVRRRRYAHVAAQLDPEEGRILEPRGARRYLQDYFQEEAISIYWGSPDDFAHELLNQWQDRVL